MAGAAKQSPNWQGDCFQEEHLDDVQEERLDDVPEEHRDDVVGRAKYAQTSSSPKNRGTMSQRHKIFIHNSG